VDSINQDVLTKAGEMLAALDPAQTGEIHTVTLTLDGHSGGCQVTVECSLSSDVVFLVR